MLTPAAAPSGADSRPSVQIAADLQSLFVRSGDFFCIHDLGGKLLSLSPSACAALGYSPADLARLPARTLLAAGARPLFVAYLGALRRDGHAAGRMRMRTRDGEERVWEYRCVVVDAEAGRVAGVARDVTGEEATRRAGSESEERFRDLVETGADVIAIVDLGGTVSYCSPSAQEVLGRRADALVGTSYAALVEEADRPALVGLLTRAAAGDGAERAELRMRTAAGECRAMELLAKRRQRGKQPRGIVISARDLTARKLLEQQLEQASRLASLGRLAATVAHEFNNVLMGMMPFAELLERDGARVEVVERAVRHLGSSIQRGKRVAQEILRFTQPAEPALQPVGLREWMERSMPEVQVLLGDHIDIATFLPDVTVLADPTQLSQILTNLVCNARDAMAHSRGRLTLRARVPRGGEVFRFGVVPEPDRFVQFSVEDTGSGIPPELLGSVFEPLFTTKRSGGTGLGLAVVHQLVKGHGGHVFAESALGRGSTFHLFLRRIDEPITAEPEDPRAGVTPRVRVLLVDDEDAICAGVAELLTRLGMDVETTGTAAAALEAVARRPPDIAVLDIGLPDLDGVKLAERVRARCPLLPIVFSTGHGDTRAIPPDDRMALIQKPFRVRELVDRMRALLAPEGQP